MAGWALLSPSAAETPIRAVLPLIPLLLSSVGSSLWSPSLSLAFAPAVSLS
jgi:hypothetical protein